MRSLCLLVLCAITVHAQPPAKPAIVKDAPPDPKDEKPFVSNAIEPKDGKLTIPLTLTPAGVKKPISRYFVTPQYSEMKPGNRVPTFMRAYMEQDNFYSKEPRAKRERWIQMRLQDLPLEEIKASGCIGGLAYRDSNALFASRGRPLGDVDEGARQLTADWQIWFNIREDGIGTLLPEVQKMREHAATLKIRMRYEIATGDIEKALYSARTFHGLATAFESHPTLIGLLVGIAIEFINLAALEELIQHPDCPNLYWSFTEIPAKVLDSRLASSAERLLVEDLFRPFVTATDRMSEEEIYKHLKRIDNLTGLAGGADNQAKKYSLDVGIRSTDKKKVEAAKKMLVETGFKAGTVEKWSELQTVATADIRQYEILLDEMLIASSLPYPAAMKQVDLAESRMKEPNSRLAQIFAPTNRKIVAAHVRLQQYVAYLRIIEAIRLYAFEHDGRLPAKLADCSVPLPLDPVTEKAFEYSVKDGVATLHGGDPSAPPPGNTDPARIPNGQTNRYYEIRIKK